MRVAGKNSSLRHRSQRLLDRALMAWSRPKKYDSEMGRGCIPTWYLTSGFRKKKQIIMQSIDDGSKFNVSIRIILDIFE